LSYGIGKRAKKGELMNYYSEIKKELVANQINKKVKDYSKNKYELQKYYNVGKLLLEAGNKYGEGIIKEYSIRLTQELGKGYSQRNLRNMRQLYKTFALKWQTMSAKLTFSHYCEIIWYEEAKINYYIKITELNNLSVRQLRNRIKCNEYERLPGETKIKLSSETKIEVEDFIKEPIIIKNSKNYEKISEKVLQKLILEDIPSFLKELGNGFTFIENEYKVKIGERWNFIDLLLFNYKYNCFVVIELKVVELKKEHIGQIEVYMNYIDKNLKQLNQNKTIGIIICRKNNKYIIEYCSDKRIISKEYELV